MKISSKPAWKASTPQIPALGVGGGRECQLGALLWIWGQPGIWGHRVPTHQKICSKKKKKKKQGRREKSRSLKPVSWRVYNKTLSQNLQRGGPRGPCKDEDLNSNLQKPCKSLTKPHVKMRPSTVSGYLQEDRTVWRLTDLKAHVSLTWKARTKNTQPCPDFC